MEILLLLIVVALSLIVYKLNKIEKTLLMPDNAKIDLPVFTSLNPLFSEKEIISYKNASDGHQEKIDYYVKLMMQNEKKEIEQHQKLGKDKSEFEPSVFLKHTIENQAQHVSLRDRSDRCERNMIEANISILNGKSITDAQEFYYEQSIPENKIQHTQKLFEDFLLERRKFWQESWNHIIEEKDYI